MSDAPAGTGRAPVTVSAAAGRPRGPAQPGSRWKALFFLIAILAVVAGTAWALLDSRLLVVRYVHVTGTGRLVSRAEVTAAAGIPSGLPLIRVDTAAVARRVEQITQVQSAQVSRDWPDAVTITVRQRRPVFAVPASGGYALVDAFGVTVRTAARAPAGMPLLAAAGPAPALRGSPAVRAAAAVCRELPRWITRRLRAVAAPDQYDVSLRLADGVTIVWGSPQRAAGKLKELKILMRATQARRYDVSAPGTAMTQG